jgi:hypothetical protein
VPPAGDPASLPPASDPPPDDPDEPPVAPLPPELPEPPEDGVPPPDPLPVLPPEPPAAPQRLELVEQSASWRPLVAELNLLKMLLWKASIAASTRQLTKAKRIMYSERP